MNVAVVDLGMGNLRSVVRALERAASDAGIDARVELTSDPAAVRRADRVVVPGQGAFRDCAAALGAGLGDALRASIDRGAPYLGICLGLQALFDESEEAPGARGLGLFGGRVVRLPEGAADESGARAKVPHMGWNRLEPTREGAGPLGVFDGAPPHVYFVHSFHAVPDDPTLVAAFVRHGPTLVTAAIQRSNVTGTQFHPEKSQRPGLQLLGRFLTG